MTAYKHTLPTLAELHETDPEKAFKVDRLNLLLSSPTNKNWVKKHPTITVKNATGAFVKLEYLPTDKCEHLLRKIFGQFKREIIFVGSIFNSAYVVERLHYLNPVTETWEFQDGVGAVGIQTDAGFPAADMSKIKSDGVMKALPAASSYAFKNACKKLGSIFGGDLNNYEAEVYEPTFNKPLESEKTVFDKSDTQFTPTGVDKAQESIAKLQAPVNVEDALKNLAATLGGVSEQNLTQPGLSPAPEGQIQF